MGVTPPVACMVPTRFTVGAVPVFVTQKLTVTVSPGSITALFGTQPSAVSVVDPAVIIGTTAGTEGATCAHHIPKRLLLSGGIAPAPGAAYSCIVHNELSTGSKCVWL